MHRIVRVAREMVGLMILCMFILVPRAGWSMPNFARATSQSCEGCHTVIPRLNEDGFQFRKAGFRLPGDIGKDIAFSLGNTFAARVQARIDSNHRTSGAVKSTVNRLTLHEITLYPLTGAFHTHYASMMELSLANEDFLEVENGYFRYTAGTENSWWTGRFGIFHPFEGYGASDRPYSISRPLFQTVPANQTGSTFFTPWNFDQAGLELAYVHDRTSLSGTVFNGIYFDEAEAKAFPAAGGELQKPAGFAKSNAKDVQAFVNQILKPDGSGISGFLYYGHIDLPKTAVSPFTPDSSFGNNFIRLAGYGSWMLMPKLGVQGGYQYGKDHFFDVLTGTADQTFKSQGYFGEVDAPVYEHVTLGARYDHFDPSSDIDDNELTAVTGFANMPLNNGLQGIAEFKHQARKRGATPDLKDDNFQFRVIWIW